MSDEATLNLKYFDENINSGKNFNLVYKKSYEKEDHIITGECILNYLLENKYTKPFIKENYMMKSDDNSYFQKLNIKNYKTKLNNIINKNKNKPVSLENSIIKNILGILEVKHNKKNKRNCKFNNYNLKENNENKPAYLNTEGNKEIKNSFYEKYLLPKINFGKKQIKKINENNKSSYDSNKDIFKNTSIIKTIEIEENSFRNNILKKNLNYYSTCLRKNILPIFKQLNQRQSISVKKGKELDERLNKLNDFKLNIKSYTDLRRDNNKSKEIKNIKIYDKKSHLINLFKDIGKVKNPREIEETLFYKEDKKYKLLKSKNMLLYIRNKHKLNLQNE